MNLLIATRLRERGSALLFALGIMVLVVGGVAVATMYSFIKTHIPGTTSYNVTKTVVITNWCQCGCGLAVTNVNTNTCGCSGRLNACNPSPAAAPDLLAAGNVITYGVDDYGTAWVGTGGSPFPPSVTFSPYTVTASSITATQSFDDGSAWLYRYDWKSGETSTAMLTPATRTVSDQSVFDVTLLRSTNLLDWNPVDKTSLASGTWTSYTDLDPRPQAFYRTVNY